MVGLAREASLGGSGRSSGQLGVAGRTEWCTRGGGGCRVVQPGYQHLGTTTWVHGSSPADRLGSPTGGVLALGGPGASLGVGASCLGRVARVHGEQPTDRHGSRQAVSSMP